MELSSITLYEKEIYLKIEEYRLFSDLIFENSIYPYTGSTEGLNLLIEKIHSSVIFTYLDLQNIGKLSQAIFDTNNTKFNNEKYTVDRKLQYNALQSKINN